MADFTDEEDIQLIQNAKLFVDGDRPICWDYVQKNTKTKKTRKQLQNRLKTLKRTHGRDFNAYPARFRRVTRAEVTLLRNPPPIMTEDAWSCIDSLFASVPKRLVHQRSGRAYENVGEVVPRGVSKLIAAVGHITDRDIFLDVGAGLGNIVCQVALETRSSLCIGIEIQKQLVDAAVEMISNAARQLTLLRKVTLVAGDFRHCDLQQPTILYSANKLFTSECNSALLRVICSLQSLHTVVLSMHPCPRHTPRCFDEFCMLWTLDKAISVDVSYSSSLLTFYMFKRHRW